MSTKGKIEKLNEEREGKVSGGIIIAVKPEIAKKCGLGDFNTYMVVDEESRKIIGSYKTKEEAENKDHGRFNSYCIWFDETDLKYKLYKDEDNDWCIKKAIIEGGFNYLDPHQSKRR